MAGGRHGVREVEKEMKEKEDDVDTRNPAEAAADMDVSTVEEEG